MVKLTQPDLQEFWAKLPLPETHNQVNVSRPVLVSEAGGYLAVDARLVVSYRMGDDLAREFVRDLELWLAEWEIEHSAI